MNGGVTFLNPEGRVGRVNFIAAKIPIGDPDPM